jgi:hypothetical protein
MCVSGKRYRITFSRRRDARRNGRIACGKALRALRLHPIAPAMFSEGLGFALRYVTASPILHRRCGACCIRMTSSTNGFRIRKTNREPWNRRSKKRTLRLLVDQRLHATRAQINPIPSKQR